MPEHRDSHPRPRLVPGVGRPARRRGGHELPDDVQDRPEQNAGYDEAVHSGPAGTPEDPLMELDADLHPDETLGAQEGGPGGDRLDLDERLAQIDDRAEQRAANDVRRRERSGR